MYHSINRDALLSNDSLAARNPSKNFWKVAVNATKGILHLTAPQDTIRVDINHRRNCSQDATAMPWPECIQPIPSSSKSSRKAAEAFALRKSRSSPTLKRRDRQITGRTLPLLPSSLSPASRRAQRAAPGRPVISHPSLPYRLDSHNPKLSSPSPLINLQSVKPYRMFSSSSSSVTSPNSSTMVNAYSSDSKIDVRRDLTATRRRTQSASGLCPEKLKMPPNPRSVLDLDLPPTAIYSPTFSTASSVSLQTPRTPASHWQDPFASPKSISSVKRKPVPRHLYCEGMDIEPSCQRPPPPVRPPPHAPFQEDNPIIDAVGVRTDAMRLPVGSKIPTLKRKPGNSGHGRSLSEFGVVGSPTLTAWNGDPLDDAVVEYPALKAPRARNFTPPPSSNEHLPYPGTMKTPSPARSCIRSDDEARGSALSPLTDEEIVAIRTFVKRHTAGQKARQRRQRSVARQQFLHEQSHAQSQSESENEPNMCTIRHATSFNRERGSYSANADIFAAYLEQHDLSLARAASAQSSTPDSDADIDPEADTSEHELEPDVLSYRTSSSPRTISQRRRNQEHVTRVHQPTLEIDTSVVRRDSVDRVDGSETGADAEDDSDMSQRDELETPVDGSNRRTFGYYGSEMIGLGVSTEGGTNVQVFDEQQHGTSVQGEENSGTYENTKLPSWSCRRLPPALGVSDSSADEREREHNEACTSPLRVRKQASRSLSRHPAQSPRARLPGFFTRDNAYESSVSADSVSMSSPPRRALATTGVMGVPILNADELSQLESASEREVEEVRGRRLHARPHQRRLTTSNRAFLPRDSLLVLLQHEDDTDISDSSAFSRLLPPPRPISSSTVSRSDSDDFALGGLSSSFDRLQMSLSKLKMHAPLGDAAVETPGEQTFRDRTRSRVRSALKPAIHIQTSPETRIRKTSRSPPLGDKVNSTPRSPPKQHYTLPPRSDTVAFHRPSDFFGRIPGTPPAANALGSSTSSCTASSSTTSTVAPTRSFMQLTPNAERDRDSDSGVGNGATARPSASTSKLPLRRLFAGFKTTARRG